ncbi:WecB/TagA/CpsF family glycosyltransferase [Lacticaseibacillus parakribbianus]|uniref:WecB/TagA/CpsF family glycosyltransferase n=1 Tax=Lacticaseibacillus parakribbianus TaxID=2970927 RepID=UPI0021CB5C8D|nr:WecB/TagA/CpsF family glycosyltransferase [Lacticaseibacillus parakribbianus]
MARLTILGTPFDDGTEAQFLTRFQTRLAKGVGTFVVTANPEIVMYARTHPDYQALIAKRADFVTADGIGILLGARILGSRLAARVTGYDLMQAMLQAAAAEGLRVALVGAKAAVLGQAKARLTAQHPGLNVCYQHDGYFDLADASVADAVVAAQPDLIFAALGFPKQERFLAGLQKRLPRAFMMGVGGSFDVAAGVVSRAPRWMQRVHLEWFYRLLKEPSRIGRMMVLPQFVWVVWRTRHQKGQR